MYLHFGRKHWYFFQWKANQGYMQVQAMESKPEVKTLEVLIADLKNAQRKALKVQRVSTCSGSTGTFGARGSHRTSESSMNDEGQ